MPQTPQWIRESQSGQSNLYLTVWEGVCQFFYSILELLTLSVTGGREFSKPLNIEEIFIYVLIVALKQKQRNVLQCTFLNAIKIKYISVLIVVTKQQLKSDENTHI